MKIHADDCPAGMHDQCCYMCDEKCTAQAALAELVAAASVLVGCLPRRSGRKIHNPVGRLDAALKPFREEKPR